ncbi:hypothetical protein BGZ46_009190 [Entomortierella lignicola]|nr:hypothetical protein BGZ46_009190 [Entomortierella lignicola]
MATSTLQLLPSNDSDPSSLNGYDLKRLKVYSSCLRCRAKKVKCDRKEPCSRCEKHSVECSYRELASVQLDIRQFQRHLNNPKIRKDGSGLLTSTATPIPTSIESLSSFNSFSSSSPASTMTTTTTSSSAISASPSTSQGTIDEYTTVSPSLSPKPSPHNNYECPNPIACGSLATEPIISNSTSAQDKNPSLPMEGVRVHKVHRRGQSFRTSKIVYDDGPSRVDYSNNNMNTDMSDISDISDHVDRVQLSDSSSSMTDKVMSSDTEEDHANVPIWRAQAVGKHKQTVHEQDMAETFDLAAYLKAKEMEISKDPSRAGQTIDFEMELERALTQRMPSSFSRSDRLHPRVRKHGSSATPYARPSHCQLSSFSGTTKDGNIFKNHAQPPTTIQCCCQIAALQGQALDSCPYSNVSHGGYDRSSLPVLSPSTSSSQTTADSGDSPRIAYSPSYSPRYSHRDTTSESSTSPSFSLPEINTSNWQSAPTTYRTILPPLPSPSSSSSRYSMSSKMDISSPSTELPPIRLTGSSEVSAFQVGRDGDEPIQIECKYNEPNVDAWDMIEKPISRKIPMTTKRGRSIKMEMGWILS